MIAFALARSSASAGSTWTRRSGSSPDFSRDPERHALLQILVPFTGISLLTRPGSPSNSMPLLILYRNAVEACVRFRRRSSAPHAAPASRARRRSSASNALALPAILTGLRVATVSTIDRDHRTVRHRQGSGPADLCGALAGHLQDGDLHGRRHGHPRSRSSPTGCSAHSTPPRRLGARMKTFVSAFRFMADNPASAREDGRAPGAVGRRARHPRCCWRSPSGLWLGRTCTAGSSSPRASRTSAGRCRASCSSPSD